MRSRRFTMNNNEAIAVLRRAALELKCSLEIANVDGLELVNTITIDSYDYNPTPVGEKLFALDMQDIGEALKLTKEHVSSDSTERAYINHDNFHGY
jgi:hypothetical protein